MKTKMTHAMRMELANAIRGRYVAAASKDKRRILEEFIAATGYHDKSAIRVLNRPSEPKSRQTRRRPSLYDEAARGALIVLWEASDRVCGKRLKALLPILLPALERNGHLKLDETIRPKILAMSASTIDRFLRTPSPHYSRKLTLRRILCHCESMRDERRICLNGKADSKPVNEVLSLLLTRKETP